MFTLRNLIPVSILLMFGTAVFGQGIQEIKLRRGKVFADGEVVMTYDKLALGTDIHLECLQHEKMIVCIDYRDNGSSRNHRDDYTRIKFGNHKKALVTNIKMGLRNWVYLMIKEGVFTKDWELDIEGAKAFIEKYEREFEIRE